MELIKSNWSSKDYDNYLDYLQSLKDTKYLKFNRKLTFTKYKMIGIRIPILRKIALQISKGDVKSFLLQNKNTYYEEVFIKGFVIASIKDINVLKKYIKEFVCLIDDWSICDSFCNSLKIIKENKDEFFDYFKEFIKSKEEFTIRLALVVFLNFYLESKYLKEIFSLIDKHLIDSKYYYVNMAIAWLIAEAFTKNKEETLEFMKRTKINKFCFNKAKSKLNDSFRVSKEDKLMLKTMKRKDL